MVEIHTSKNQALFVGDSNNAQERGKHKGKETKNIDSNPKENHKSSDGSSGSRKEKTRCPYCLRGFHLESHCMKKTLYQLTTLLEHNNISLPQGAKNYDVGQPIEDHERFHALKEGFTQLKAYLIDYGASNNMVASKESFSTLTLSRGPNIHMGDDSQNPAT